MKTATTMKSAPLANTAKALVYKISEHSNALQILRSRGGLPLAHVSHQGSNTTHQASLHLADGVVRSQLIEHQPHRQQAEQDTRDIVPRGYSCRSGENARR